MATFKVYDSFGRTAFDSSQSVYNLIKAGHLELLNTNAADNISQTLRWVMDGQHNYIYYIDVQAKYCPIAFMHFDGGILDGYGVHANYGGYRLIHYVSTILVRQGYYRFFFVSMKFLTAELLNKIRIYIFDACFERTNVGINTYDRQGNLTFSTKNPLLNIVGTFPRAWQQAVYVERWQQGIIRNRFWGEIRGRISAELESKGYDINRNIFRSYDYAMHFYQQVFGDLWAMGISKDMGQLPDARYTEGFLKRMYYDAQGWVECRQNHNTAFVDVLVKPLVHDVRYATLCTQYDLMVGVQYLAYQPDVYLPVSYGVKGGIISALALYTGSPSPDWNVLYRPDAKFSMNEPHTKQQLSNVITADVTHLPFPYN